MVKRAISLFLRMHYPRFLILIPAIFICLSSGVRAQQFSENGWALPVKDTLRILVLFGEVIYDTLPELEFLPNGNKVWPKGSLPTYADSLFDTGDSPIKTGGMTRYYSEISLGNFYVFGDYHPNLIQIPYSGMRSGGVNAMLRILVDSLAASGSVLSANGFTVEDFDLWEKSSGRGLKILPRTGEYQGVDHLMVLIRNYHVLGGGSGQASPSSFGLVEGKRTDSYSVFAGGARFPFSILRHELNHLFLGGNNFHSGGGNSAGFTSYVLPVQGGWAMMGGANSSFLTCSAWDRYRLGWAAEGNEFLISARDDGGKEVNSDLDASRGEDAGIYYLRDFQTTGDALRIKLPFIPEDQFQQWLWLENHTTFRFNGSEFDRFQYEKHDCTSFSNPGIYMQMQVDAEEKEGGNIFTKVNADYLRPVLANGNYDLLWSRDKVSPGFCVNGEAYRYYEQLPERENPLTGNHDQEISLAVVGDSIFQLDHHNLEGTMIKKTNGEFSRLDLMGNEFHAFRQGGNDQLGIGTNPSGASMLTTLNSRKPRKPHPQNSNAVYLNGISVKILETFPDGTVKLEIVFDDNSLADSRRWCAPEIILQNHNLSGPDLYVTGTLNLARGLTPTRFDHPDSILTPPVFTDRTIMKVTSGAEIENDRGTITLHQDSELHFHSGSRLIQNRRSRVRLRDSSTLFFHADAQFQGRGCIRISKSSVIYCADQETWKAIRARTCQKKRVILGAGEPDVESAP